MIHRLSQLDSDSAGYAEKLLQASTVGQYCKRLAGIIQVESACSGKDISLVVVYVAIVRGFYATWWGKKT